MMRIAGIGRHLKLDLLRLCGRDAAALAACERILVAWPHDERALAARIQLLAQDGRGSDALRDSHRLVGLRSDSAADWFNHGFLLQSAAEWNAALVAFERAVALHPGLDRAWYGKGLMLLKLGLPADAFQAFKRQTELQPMAPHGWCEMARIHAAAREFAAALRLVQHLAGFEPRVARALAQEIESAVRVPTIATEGST